MLRASNPDRVSEAGAQKFLNSRSIGRDGGMDQLLDRDAIDLIVVLQFDGQSRVAIYAWDLAASTSATFSFIRSDVSR